MIGVIADPSELDVVREFFELFKTPWELYRGDRRYDVVLCAGDVQPGAAAKLLVIYAGRRISFDDQQQIRTGQPRENACVLSYRGNQFPVYRGTLTFSMAEDKLLTDEESQECIAYLDVSGEKTRARVGYELFREVRTLLTTGQPPSNASMPALELHIAILRNLITDCGLPLVEIPPIPEGYGFIACLTHDVDHPAIRQHSWDHTTFGFLYRAVFGSLRNCLGGRLPVQDLLTNWGAAFKLPFVHLRLAKDFWHDFDDRYLEIEGDFPSTYFVIPFKNYQGKHPDGTAPALRAARYDVQDIADAIRKLISAGCEVGLHGIDAWLDSSKGRAELEVIRSVTGASEVGVRMHWLYYDQGSPSALESAGAKYDSTVGYNQTVGYRAGTTQVYKPLGASRMLELPLHIMDTALFYPTYLHLSSRQAKTLIAKMADNVVQFGGTLTINWHDRSTAPERLWGGCYSDLIQQLKSRGAWFSTAEQAVSWFRKRRSAKFVTDSIEPGIVTVTVERSDNLPALRLRIFKARKSNPGCSSPLQYRSEDYVDAAIDQTIDFRVPLKTSI